MDGTQGIRTDRRGIGEQRRGDPLVQSKLRSVREDQRPIHRIGRSMTKPTEDRPRTIAWPVLARVLIETRTDRRMHSPVRQKAVAQVVDFYPKEKPCVMR